jgi:type VI protein secretion system component Hcp
MPEELPSRAATLPGSRDGAVNGSRCARKGQEMAIYVLIPSVVGDVAVPGYETCFAASSFGFGIEREMKESGEKGGTEDINIGVGELQECTLSKSMDSTSSQLAQFAINGNSLGTAEIFFVDAGGRTEGRPTCYLQYKLDRCFVKSWSTSVDADGRPTERVAFYYNRIAFQHAATDGKNAKPGPPMSWDIVRNRPWDAHGIVFKGA